MNSHLDMLDLPMLTSKAYGRFAISAMASLLAAVGVFIPGKWSSRQANFRTVNMVCILAVNDVVDAI